MRGASLFLLLAMSFVWIPPCEAAAPDDEPVVYDLTIDRQPLGHALQVFAKQSRIQIIFFSRLTQGMRSPALYGQYTMAAALTILLKESGLSFRVLNPTTIEILPRRQGAEMNDSEQSNVDPTVFVVDDDPRICEALSCLFILRGIQVVTFRSAAGYLAYPRPDGPGCLILDVGLPDISGYELARRIRATTWGGNADLIAVTGWGQESDREQAFRAGFDHHLTKPISTDALETLLQSLHLHPA